MIDFNISLKMFNYVLFTMFLYVCDCINPIIKCVTVCHWIVKFWMFLFNDIHTVACKRSDTVNFLDLKSNILLTKNSKNIK